MVEEGGGVSGRCDVARGRSSEVKAERIEVGKSKCQSVVGPSGVESKETCLREHHRSMDPWPWKVLVGCEISRQSLRLKVVSFVKPLPNLVRGFDTFCNIS